MRMSRQVFSHPAPFVEPDGPGELQVEENSNRPSGKNPSFQVIAREREEMHTRVVKELSSLEEPLEMSLKKTMATPTVGYETARARKLLGNVAISKISYAHARSW